MKQYSWTFLTYHGRVLVYLTNHPHATCREIAQEAGVTERSVQKVVHDLVADGYLVRQRTGRGNTYEIHPELPMRHRMERDHIVGDLLKALGCDL
jgi:DNA-binding MarR family transcriptional regulator